MVDMTSEVIKNYPGIFTKKGMLRKRGPQKYICKCGHSFSTQKVTLKLPWLTLTSPICSECGEKASDNIEYNVWKRMENGQIEQEDFILNVVKEKGVIQKEELLALLHEKFLSRTDALGTLVYFGYLTVVPHKRDKDRIVEHRVNPNKQLENRYELIR